VGADDIDPLVGITGFGGGVEQPAAKSVLSAPMQNAKNLLANELEITSSLLADCWKIQLRPSDLTLFSKIILPATDPGIFRRDLCQISTLGAEATHPLSINWTGTSTFVWRLRRFSSI